MPTTPNLALPYPAPTDPADVPADMQRLANAVDQALGAFAATPPATPVNGELWTMSPAAGVAWQFRYNAGSASAFKWEFVGGPAWMVAADAQFTTSAVAYTDGDGLGPSVTPPRAGDYLFSFGFMVNGSSANIGVAAPATSTAAAADTNAAWAPIAASTLASVTRDRLLAGLTAGTPIGLRYKLVNAAATNFAQRWLSIQPVRVS